MFSKLKTAQLRSYLKIRGAIRNFKEDRRGGIVEYVLLVLVGVLAIAILWGLLGQWIVDMWNRIINGSDPIQ